MRKSTNHLRGDTLIEVLIAIAIAGFALGTSYAIATKTMQRAVSARERNQATNIVQSQIIALKTREQQMDASTFSAFTANPSVKHFCLDETVTSPSPTGWTLTNINNNSIDNSNGLNNSLYDPKCIRTIDGATYYIDIVAKTTPTSPVVNPTVYVFNVRWPDVATSDINQASVYYRF